MQQSWNITKVKIKKINQQDVGDNVNIDEIIAEVETDKVNVNIF